MIEKSINGIHLEICANSLSSAKEAQLGGASRVELCQNLENGGTTPSYGQIKLVREALEIGVHVLIRPRAGDFLYSDDEFAEIKEDILYCKEAGCDGVVIGILTKDGGVDKVRMQELVDLARPMCVVFHRAFDRCAEPLKSLEDIIELGCDRILTSGLKNSAWEGRELIKALVDKADGRIEIMPGAGIDESNVKAIIEFTGVRCVHSSAKVLEASKMVYNQTNVKGMDEDVISSSSERVAQIIEQIKSL
ncbi:copper homeostasis protein CutC [Sphingobacterium hotanense]|uniref:copper homeostasis protein CutC n=1 Tax=Sphingobacterium hotanense TaxID=649196 RepID=UPI0021A3A2C4|nr:copper homeostasis protein CutC [Sphingobacterium hotanense]MCT1526540.1 copper homeostasis protein CutC [Sphingobacterium hotanense]